MEYIKMIELLFLTFNFQIQEIRNCPLPTTYYLLPNAYCLLKTVYADLRSSILEKL